MADEGARYYLLFYPKDKPSIAAASYIAHGEAKKLDAAYRCTVREPRYRVPLVQTPDLFLTYMNHDRPRFVKNDAQVEILNSLYGVPSRTSRRWRIQQFAVPVPMSTSRAHCALAYDERTSRSIRTLLRRKDTIMEQARQSFRVPMPPHGR